jgi:hypothetical protein
MTKFPNSVAVLALFLSSTAVSQVAPARPGTFKSLPPITIPEPSLIPTLDPPGPSLQSGRESHGPPSNEAPEHSEFPTPGKVLKDVGEDKLKEKVLERIQKFIAEVAPKAAATTETMLKISGWVGNIVSLATPVVLAPPSIDDIHLGPNGPAWVWMPGIAYAKNGIITSIGPGSWLCQSRCDGSAPPPPLPDTRHVGEPWPAKERQTDSARKQAEPDAKRKADEQAAADAKRRADEQAAADAKRRAEQQAAADAMRRAEQQAAADALATQQRKAQAEFEQRLKDQTDAANAAQRRQQQQLQEQLEARQQQLQQQQQKALQDAQARGAQMNQQILRQTFSPNPPRPVGGPPPSSPTYTPPPVIIPPRH